MALGESGAGLDVLELGTMAKKKKPPIERRHPSARTTLRMRRKIQRHGGSNAALARKYGVNPKTIAKWKSSPTVLDAPMGPKHPVSSVLTAEAEALCVVFRRHTRLSIDDCLAQLKPIIPELSRSALHRCLKRHGVSRIPKGFRSYAAEFDGEESEHFTIEVHALPDCCLFMAINETFLVFAECWETASATAAAGFLESLYAYASFNVRSVETLGFAAFMEGPFQQFCLGKHIDHYVAKSKTIAPKPFAKGWGRSLKWPQRQERSIRMVSAD